MAALDWFQCPAVESIYLESLEAGANIDDVMQWYEGLAESRSWP